VLDEHRAVHAPDAIANQLVHAGCPPTRLAVEQEDLEAYFLRLVRAGSDD
jgi:ABC-2 type transport system ATP-binding protein